MATVTILKIRLLSQSPTPEIQNIKLNALVADNPQTENQRLDYGTQLLVTNDPVFFSMDWILLIEAFQKLCLLVSGSP